MDEPPAWTEFITRQLCGRWRLSLGNMESSHGMALAFAEDPDLVGYVVGVDGQVLVRLEDVSFVAGRLSFRLPGQGHDGRATPLAVVEWNERDKSFRGSWSGGSQATPELALRRYDD